METIYTIGQLATEAGVAPSTVRYYERRGLIQPEGRTGSNYRVYGPSSLRRLRFIRIAQSSGFTLEDIALLLRLREGRENPCGEVKGLIEKRLGRIDRQLDELRHFQKVLRATLRWCIAPDPKERCPVLDDLDARSGGERAVDRRRGRS